MTYEVYGRARNPELVRNRIDLDYVMSAIDICGPLGRGRRQWGDGVSLNREVTLESELSQQSIK